MPVKSMERVIKSMEEHSTSYFWNKLVSVLCCFWTSEFYCIIRTKAAGIVHELNTSVSIWFNPGMDPAWSGRGGRGGGVLCQLWCWVVSVMCARPPINLLHYCKVLLDYCIWIVVHSSLIIMLLLKLLYLILSLIIFCFIMKNSTPPAPPLARARGGGGAHTVFTLVKFNFVYDFFQAEKCFSIYHVFSNSFYARRQLELKLIPFLWVCFKVL
jgi:hypothetical protein